MDAIKNYVKDICKLDGEEHPLEKAVMSAPLVPQ